MEFKNVRVFNFEGALRGMRNPKESWHLSDSKFGLTLGYPALETFHDMYDEAYGQNASYNNPDYIDYMYKNVFIRREDNGISEYALIGPKDMKLAQTLILAGAEHRKFMRQIFVSVDITAPLFYWKEFDTYKVGTVSNSTSTMHKITSKPITADCFENDEEENDFINDQETLKTDDIINFNENLRQQYIKTKDRRYWKALIRWLPSSWLQTRTVTMTYENIFSMIHQRENHKLTEWSVSTINFFKTLPYADELLFVDKIKNL